LCCTIDDDPLDRDPLAITAIVEEGRGLEVLAVNDFLDPEKRMEFHC
jgi:hypothetical protein